VEVKTPGGRLSPEQWQFLETVRGLGGLAVVVKSWRDLAAALRGAGYAEDGPLFDGAPEGRGGDAGKTGAKQRGRD
jgi:hypothetical protein